MKWAEYLDKENGTRFALDRHQLGEQANREYHSGDPSCSCGDMGCDDCDE